MHNLLTLEQNENAKESLNKIVSRNNHRRHLPETAAVDSTLHTYSDYSQQQEQPALMNTFV